VELTLLLFELRERLRECVGFRRFGLRYVRLGFIDGSLHIGSIGICHGKYGFD
jgi:hypothetical protein